MQVAGPGMGGGVEETTLRKGQSSNAIQRFGVPFDPQKAVAPTASPGTLT